MFRQGATRAVRKTFDRIVGGKLSNQLIASFIGMFLIIVTISMVVAYYAILDILKNNSKNDSLKTMSQYDYNLHTFRNEMDQIFRQIIFPNQASVTDELQQLTDVSELSEVDRTVLIYQVLQTFSQKMSNYSYIRSINFYSDTGVTLGASPEANRFSYDVNSREHQFYRSSLREIAVTDPNRLIWLGGFGERQFKLAENRSKQSSAKRYVTVIRSLFSGNKAAVIAINIDLDYFTSIYNRADGAQGSRMYMVDASGMIVSHNDHDRIGQRIDIQALKDAGLSKDSLSADLERDGRQIMAYNVGSLGWILINEVPLKLFIQDAAQIRTIGFVTLMIGLALAIILSRFWIRRVTLPLVRLTAAIRKVKAGSLGTKVETETTSNELGILIDQFNLMTSNLASVIEQKEKIEEEKRTIEVHALQSQINPHLIYNTLNTIKWMAVMIKANNIADSITALSEILAPLFKKQQVLCTLEEELNYIHYYIKIMKFRYGSSFREEIDIPDEMRACQTLRFILQPIVENAIYHGLSSRQGGSLVIAGALKDNMAIITVTDDGEGLTAGKLSEVKNRLNDTGAEQQHDEAENGIGIGLRNVQRRIQLHFGERYGIAIDSRRGKGTEVQLTIPRTEKAITGTQASSE